MAKASKIKPVDPDVSYLDPTTNEVVCTFNGCLDKFTIEDSEVVSKVFSWNQDKAVSWNNYFHKCNECGRHVSTKADKKKSMLAYMENKFYVVGDDG